MRISLDSPLPLPTNFAVETNEARGRLCSVQSKTKREGEGSVCRRGCAAINTRASMRVIRNRIRSAANVGRRFIYGKYRDGRGVRGSISPTHAPIPVIPCIFTRVSERRPRVIYANTRARNEDA